MSVLYWQNCLYSGDLYVRLSIFPKWNSSVTIVAYTQITITSLIGSKHTFTLARTSRAVWYDMKTKMWDSILVSYSTIATVATECYSTMQPPSPIVPNSYIEFRLEITMAFIRPYIFLHHRTRIDLLQIPLSYFCVITEPDMRLVRWCLGKLNKLFLSFHVWPKLEVYYYCNRYEYSCSRVYAVVVRAPTGITAWYHQMCFEFSFQVPDAEPSVFTM